MLPKSDNKTSIICTSLFNSGLSSSELDKELAYVAIQEEHGFNDLIPQKIPIAPFSFSAYQNMNDDDKKQFCLKNPEYFRDGEGGKYLDSVSKAKNMTESHLRWLIKIRNIFESIGDEKSLEKVSNRILIFK